jgi:hypothetical protein
MVPAFAALSLFVSVPMSVVFRSAAKSSRCFDRPAPHLYCSPHGFSPAETIAWPLFPIPAAASSSFARFSVAP